MLRWRGRTPGARVTKELAVVNPPDGGQGSRSLEMIKALVLDAVTSPHTKRVYAKGLDSFCRWYQSAGSPGLSKAVVQEFRSQLERQGLASSSINVYLSAVRKLAAESADNGWLDAQLAAGIAKVKGVRSQGARAGNWLTAEQATELLLLPDPATRKGARDRAVLALLIGCGLRRAELARLELEHFQIREARWVLPDLVGKGKRFRTVPVPAWVKVFVDDWVALAAISGGRLFRSVNKGGIAWGEGISEDTVWSIAREYGIRLGQPNLAPHDLRRTCAKLCRASGGALEQIQLLLGHASIQTTERYLGTRQDLARAVNDNLPIGPAGDRPSQKSTTG